MTVPQGSGSTILSSAAARVYSKPRILNGEILVGDMVVITHMTALIKRLFAQEQTTRIA